LVLQWLLQSLPSLPSLPSLLLLLLLSCPDLQVLLLLHHLWITAAAAAVCSGCRMLEISRGRVVLC